MARRLIGFQRIAEPGACDWCVMLASRGADYSSGDAAAAGSHDGCHCVVVPVFEGDSWARNLHDRAIDRYTGKLSRDADARVAIGDDWKHLIGESKPLPELPDGIGFKRADLPPHTVETFQHAIDRHAGGVGIPGKTEFPWSDPGEIAAAIADVVDHGAVTGEGNMVIFVGSHRGYMIRVEYETWTGALVFNTAFPPPQVGPKGGHRIRKNAR